jgi:demethylmenaquinone methyltransferase/2-methoxy-6-polyprenyl-1,4-benzoquinol methylase
MSFANKQAPTPLAWDRAALEDPHAQANKGARLEAMFDAIAATYERVNRVVSLGRDRAWRKAAVAVSRVDTSDVVLDVCCGTGDMIRAFAAHSPPPGIIIGVDFARRMLARGVYPNIGTPIQLLRADGLRLPLRDETVSVISCAFGVRNFQDLHAGLCEMHRVLKPAGRVVILEFALPENPLFRWGYRLYCTKVLPRLAALISRDKSGAYQYLPRSIQTFERREAMAERLRRAGFAAVVATPLNLGGVVIYRGQKTPD